jgi:hypothetical protein
MLCNEQKFNGLTTLGSDRAVRVLSNDPNGKTQVHNISCRKTNLNMLEYFQNRPSKSRKWHFTDCSMSPDPSRLLTPTALGSCLRQENMHAHPNTTFCRQILHSPPPPPPPPPRGLNLLATALHACTVFSMFKIKTRYLFCIS